MQISMHGTVGLHANRGCPIIEGKLVGKKKLKSAVFFLLRGRLFGKKVGSAGI